MRSRAAILHEYGQLWSVDEFSLDPPRAGEVLIQLAASGLCRSDEHIRYLVPPDAPRRLAAPTIGGHEGSGVVVDVGEGVRHLAPGDHVVTSFVAVCGQCRWCASGMEYLCDSGAGTLKPGMPTDLPAPHARRPRPRAHLEDRRVRRTHCGSGGFSGEDR